MERLTAIYWFRRKQARAKRSRTGWQLRRIFWATRIASKEVPSLWPWSSHQRENSRCKYSASSRGSFNTPARAVVFMRRRDGPAQRASSACRGRAYRGRNAGAALRPLAAQPSRRLGLESRRAGRGRRDARSRLSRRSGIHPQNYAGHTSHATFSRQRCRAASSRSQSNIRKMRFASKWRLAKAVMPTLSIARSGSSRMISSTRSSTCLRYFESPSTIVFCNTRNAVRHLQAALLERGFFRGRPVRRVVAERTNARAAGSTRRTCARLRGHRRGGARHRSAEPRSRHSFRFAERSGGPAAPFRPHWPRRPKGCERAAGASLAPSACRIDAPPGRRRGHLGCGSSGGRYPQTRPAASAAGQSLHGGVDRGRSDNGARVACRAIARGYRGRHWPGCIALGFLRPKTSSIRAKVAADRVTIAGKDERAATSGATQMAPGPNRAGKSRAAVTAWRGAAYGFAPALDARRMPRRAGCCR